MSVPHVSVNSLANINQVIIGDCWVCFLDSLIRIVSEFSWSYVSQKLNAVICRWVSRYQCCDCCVADCINFYWIIFVIIIWNSFVGCEDIIAEAITIDNLPRVLHWSLKPHGSAWVHRQAIHFLREEFMQIVHHSVLFELNREYLIEAVSSDFLQVAILCSFIVNLYVLLFSDMCCIEYRKDSESWKLQSHQSSLAVSKHYKLAICFLTFGIFVETCSCWYKFALIFNVKLQF